MHVSLAFDPWPWYIYVWCIHLLSVILTHVCMMHVFMMRHICHACTNLDSDAYIYYACMYYAYTYAPWSLWICAWCIHLWSWSMHVCMILDPDVCMHVRCICSWSWYMWPWCMYACMYDSWLWCMCDAYVLDHDAHTYCAFIHDPWSWYMHVWCIYQLSSIIDFDACVYGTYIYGTGPWLLCMCVWCIYLWFWTLILKHACMYDSWPWCMYACAMHIYVLDPDTWLWCMCVWCTYICSSILDYDACVYDAHIYDPGPWFWSMHVCIVHVSMMRSFSVTDERTNKAILGVGHERIKF